MIGTRFACGFLAAGMVAHGRRMRPAAECATGKASAAAHQVLTTSRTEPAKLLVLFISYTEVKLKVDNPPK
jgi:hypothetical protein